VKAKTLSRLVFFESLGAKVNLRGKSRDQIAAAVAHKSRSELIDLIFSQPKDGF